MAFGANIVAAAKKGAAKATAKTPPPPSHSGATSPGLNVIPGYKPQTPTVYPSGRVVAGVSPKRYRREAQQRRVATLAKLRRLQRQAAPKPQNGLNRAAPKPPSFKPPKFQGAPTAGTPTLKSLQSASKSGTLKVNRRGYLTTPKVRQVSQELKQAKVAASKGNRIEGPLTPEQKRFVKGVAKHTGLSPRGLAAQALAEESGSAAAGYEASGEHNYLNIGPGQHFGSNRQGVRETAHLLNTSPAYAGIRATRGKGAAAQVHATGSSPWGTNESTMLGTLALVHARSNPAAKKKLQRAKAAAKSVGLKSGKKKGFKYANPLPGWTPGRTDQGFDATAPPGTPVLAVSKGKVIATGAPGWPGGGGVTYKILQGPQKGKEIYAFEDLSATVKPGQIVKRGQVVAKAGAGSIETGYYSGNQTTAGHPLHNQVVGTGQTYSVASTDGSPTVGALQFEKQILKKAVSVPASGGSAGFFVTAPTVNAYAQATGSAPARVAKELKSRRLTPEQMFKKLNRLGVGVSPGKTAAKTEAATPTGSELERLEEKYGVK
jgi:murein DD-endopeptidase MepM/ murein hydrolase activator NlpD